MKLCTSITTLFVMSLILCSIDVLGQKDTTVDLRDSVVNQNLYFNYDKISKVIRRSDTAGYMSGVVGFIFPVKINGVAEFSCGHFTNYSDFSLTHFSNKSLFEKSRFDSPAIFSYANFEQAAVFRHVFFGSDVDFYDAHFVHSANFQDATFQGIAYFAEARFNHEANFFSTIFNAKADFSGSHFNKDVGFINARFCRAVNFSDINMEDSTNTFFYDAYLPDTIIFCNVQNIRNEIDLLSANFKSNSRYDSLNDSYKEGKWHYISLYKSNISKFHLDYFHFRILLQDHVGHNLPVDEAKTVYEALLKNFKDRGQMESYDLLDIEYQDYKWKNKSYFSSFGRFLHFWNAYGHKPELPLLWTLCLVGIFTSITFLWLPFLHNNVYSIDALSSFKNVSVALSYKYLFRRLWYSFIYTSLIFFPLSLKIDKIKVQKKMGTLYLMLVYTIGLLCIGYVANFILQK